MTGTVGPHPEMEEPAARTMDGADSSPELEGAMAVLRRGID